MTGLTTVLLDIDGTLIDSNDAHASAWRAALAEQGVTVELDQVRRLIGMGGDQLLAALGLSEEQEPGRTASKRKVEIFRARLLPSIEAFASTRALVERMVEEGLQIVVVTSASADESKELLERAGVDDLVHRVTHGDTVEHTKPAPDPVETALRDAGARPEQAVMLADTPYDLESARRAGVGMIALRSGGWDFVDPGPIAVYDDPEDLLLHWDRSPLGRAVTS